MKSISKYKSKINKTKEKRQPHESKRSRTNETAEHSSSENDATEHRKIKEILRRSKELYRFLFNNSNDALFVSLKKSGENLPGKFILVNDTACQRLGYSRRKLLQMTPLDISAPLPTLPDTMQKLAIDKRVIHEEVHITKDGREIPVEISTRSFEIGGRQFNLSVARDITERKRMEEKLKQLSIRDALTGLYNRGFFDEELTRLERGRQFPISLVMADVDQLKKVNDHLGHSAGDDLLRCAAQLLTASFRAEDILARIGGDEFAIILPSTDGIAVKRILRRIRQSLQKHNTDHPNVPLGISFGVSTTRRPKPLHETLKAADANMYREKRKPSTP